MEDFNLPSAERTTLLNSLQEVIGDVPPYFWAFCQVCDLQSLEKLIRVARVSPSIVRVFAPTTYNMVLHWTQVHQGSSRNATPTTAGSASSASGSPDAKRRKIADTSTSSPLLHRSQMSTGLAKTRDSLRCVLTQSAIIEAAHIYPFCRLKGSEENTSGERHLFWESLKMFWSEEKVAAWETELFPRGLSETGCKRVDNLITLSPEAHRQWNMGAFTLKPISICEDNSLLKVQFFWQKRQNHSQATMSLSTTPFSTENLDNNNGACDDHGKVILFHEGKPVKSGQVFTLKTTDPKTLPLPSFKLLELQWALTRVVGMAGAAFPYDSIDWEDWDEDIPGLEFDELGDSSFISDPLNSPECLREVNRRLTESVKHHTEGAGLDIVETGVIM